MKNLFSFLALAFVLSACAQKNYKTTRGAEGSEWGPNDYSFDRNFSVAPQFGALIGDSDEEHSFAIGADLDYRPDELFGFRATFLQGVDSPKPSIANLSPLLFTEISNFVPYVYFGPGVANVKEDGEREYRFQLTGGAGADFLMTERFGLGLLWQGNFIFDAKDFHYIGSRVFFRF